ncbi:DUF885 domain-containing protein [Nakamurella endophytica]|uniref:DUF885 domain-containing protein n=1 Tax=Nakamurella endophytica TaxID=1748367 RepID=A0A917T6E7_9ACTN|nr:DUF885 domain-containing protein [Nakamurella endophytica]GGM11420.1 hypothetical protein GCM10011594_34190 [Nakamurella endophytica]
MGSPSTSTEITAISDQLVADMAAASPILATYVGVRGHDHVLDDLSPAGLERNHQIAVDARRRFQDAVAVDERDEVARAVAVERLEVEIDRYESGWAHATLNVIESPVQLVRQIFDLMPTDTAEDREAIAARLTAVPAALAGYRTSLALAADRGQVSAVRQIDKAAEQCRVFAGRDGGGFFTELVAGMGQEGTLGERLRSGADAAAAAYADLAVFLVRELRGVAPERDAVGRERYVLASREFLGATVNLEETYRWGWDEFLSLERELTEVAHRITSGEGPVRAAEVLDADPSYRVEGTDGLAAWMQQLSDQAIDELGRSHFEIPEPIRTLECRIAPPGGGVGAYYTGPSDDFSRPGRMWWSVEPGRTTFPTWREATIVYHEGVPGHHLQVATAVHERGLTDFQRLLAGTSGHAEGWALYAERLVRELGYLEDDGRLLGLLDSQLFRAARVVVDIGMHLELPIPAGTGFHEGERWTPALGLEFLLTRTLTDPAHVRDEVDRYLGWPGQAPSYKVGERVWLTGREDARRRHGSAFDLKDFHTRALRLGGMGLDPLAAALGRL